MYAVKLTSGNDLRTATYEYNHSREEMQKDPAKFINDVSNRVWELHTTLDLQTLRIQDLTKMATQGAQEFQNIHKRLDALDEKLDELKFLLRK